MLATLARTMGGVHGTVWGYATMVSEGELKIGWRTWMVVWWLELGWLLGWVRRGMCRHLMSAMGRLCSRISVFILIVIESRLIGSVIIKL